MRISQKLLILLSAVALLPLVCETLHEIKATTELSKEVASRVSSVLIKEASNMLEEAVEAHARLVEHQTETMELIVQIQAGEIERLLAEEPHGVPKVFFSEDYDQGINVPEDIIASPKYDRISDDGNLIPGRVSLSEVDFKLAGGVDKEAVAQDIARLEAMAPLYRLLYSKHSDIIVSMYTALESGIISSYPGMGGYPKDYDPRETIWYTQAPRTGESGWNPPSVDETGLGVLADVHMPIHRPDGSFAGITAIDVSIIQELHVTEPTTPWASSVEVFLAVMDAGQDDKEIGLRIIGKKGYQKETKDWKTPLQDEWLESSDQDKYAQMIEAIRQGQSGTLQMPFQGCDTLWAYGTVGKAGTALIFVVPMEDIVVHSNEMRQFIFNETYRKLNFAGIVAVSSIICVVVLVLYMGSRTIVFPLRALSKAAKDISGGNLDAQLPSVRSRDEIGDLTRSIALMKEDLKIYIHDLTEATASKERIESELRIARDIQMSFLPKKFPAFPHRTEFNISAAIEPAREVGGDLYDFFLIDESHLFFAIGDVSGKGVPAALFMAMTKSLMKGVARQNRSPDETLMAMNAELCEGNESCMFVTLFCGILNTRTGAVLLANAGHNPPLLLRNQEDAKFLDPVKAPILGVFEEAVYRTEGLILDPGDSLLLYTDGVTEAENESKEFYSAAGLQRTISSLRGLSPQETIGATMEKIRSFCGNTPQFDDIAMLMIRFNGP